MRSTHRVVYLSASTTTNTREKGREKKERAHLGVFLFSSLDERKRVVVSAAHNNMSKQSVFVAREENEVKKDAPFNNEKSDAIHV